MPPVFRRFPLFASWRWEPPSSPASCNHLSRPNLRLAIDPARMVWSGSSREPDFPFKPVAHSRGRLCYVLPTAEGGRATLSSQPANTSPKRKRGWRG